MLLDFEPVENGSDQPCRFSDEYEQTCIERGVVHWASEDNPRGGRWFPLCFRHAFITALARDSQAQRLALGYAVGRSLENRNVHHRDGNPRNNDVENLELRRST